MAATTATIIIAIIISAAVTIANIITHRPSPFVVLVTN